MSIDSLAKLQRDQHGLVTPAQARAEDISYAALRRRRARGALTTAQRRVLACPAVAESYEQHVLAAVLAAGETAFASHDTALALWKLPLPQPAALEDFVFDALRRFAIPLPVAQHPVVVEGRRRRIDLCYPQHALALEAKGFEFRRDRTGFDEDALRDNELTLAGFRILEFTAAFTDWRIASHVARALGMPAPRPAGRQLTFEEWKALR